jgi:hypothetical protein
MLGFGLDPCGSGQQGPVTAACKHGQKSFCEFLVWLSERLPASHEGLCPMELVWIRKKVHFALQPTRQPSSVAAVRTSSRIRSSSGSKVRPAIFKVPPGFLCILYACKSFTSRSYLSVSNLRQWQTGTPRKDSWSRRVSCLRLRGGSFARSIAGKFTFVSLHIHGTGNTTGRPSVTRYLTFIFGWSVCFQCSNFVKLGDIY